MEVMGRESAETQDNKEERTILFLYLYFDLLCALLKVRISIRSLEEKLVLIALTLILLNC